MISFFFVFFFEWRTQTSNIFPFMLHSMRQGPGHDHKKLRDSKDKTRIWDIHYDYGISMYDTPSTISVLKVLECFIPHLTPYFYSIPRVLCASPVHRLQHPSSRNIDAASEWRLLFDIDAPLWYYMQIDRDEGRGCLMCKWWFWGTANVHTTAFLLIAFPVESRNFIRERMNVSLKRTGFSFFLLWVWTHGGRSVFSITTLNKNHQAMILASALHFHAEQSRSLAERGIGFQVKNTSANWNATVYRGRRKTVTVNVARDKSNATCLRR